MNMYTTSVCIQKVYAEIAVLRPLRIANSESPVGLLAPVHPTAKRLSHFA